LTIPFSTLAKKDGKDGKYHVEGQLKLISKEDMKEIFLLLLPLIKAVRGKKIIIIGAAAAVPPGQVL
jgi:hypothetical protein